MANTAVLDLITQSLARGSLTVREEDGHVRSLFASCQADGSHAPVYRVEKAGDTIARVIFRCPRCGGQFDAAPEEMTLR